MYKLKSNFKSNLKSNKGFTLIELLVVVAIIGILSSASVVGYKVYKDSASKAVAQSSAKGLFTAVVACISASSTTREIGTCLTSLAVNTNPPCTVMNPSPEGLLAGTDTQTNDRCTFNYVDVTTANEIGESFCVAVKIKEQAHCYSKEIITAAVPKVGTGLGGSGNEAAIPAVYGTVSKSYSGADAAGFTTTLCLPGGTCKE